MATQDVTFEEVVTCTTELVPVPANKDWTPDPDYDGRFEEVYTNAGHPDSDPLAIVFGSPYPSMDTPIPQVFIPPAGDTPAISDVPIPVSSLLFVAGLAALVFTIRKLKT